MVFETFNFSTAITIANMSATTEALTFPDYAVNPNGGDVLVDNLNLHYDKGDMAWVLCATLFCWQITPVMYPFNIKSNLSWLSGFCILG